MATYSRWNKYIKGYVPQFNSGGIPFTAEGAVVKYSLSAPAINSDDGTFNISSWSYRDLSSEGDSTVLTDGYKFCLELNSGLARTTQYYDLKGGSVKITNISDFTWSLQVTAASGIPSVSRVTTTLGKGSFIGYVYSLNSSAYPNGGISGEYYYDSRTTITSPTAPSSISYPATITASSVTVSWTAASSNTSYPISAYELSYSIDGGRSWIIYTNQTATSKPVIIPIGATSIMFRVRARDSNNQWGSYRTGTVSHILIPPTLTVPEMVMQGQSATVSWSGVEGADSYTLERKSSADTDWTQVYSGDSLSYTETVGTWTSLQYRVCAVFGESATGWATSGDIQIVAASALVISGSDGDLGTLTSDVSYSVSSDQTAPVIDVTVTVNGGEYAAFQAVSGQNYSIGVLDLPTGTGSIVITATTTVSASPVTVTRTWTYTKAAQSFPNAGSVARLTQEGDTIWPQTLAEAVRTTGGPWGGDLSKALNLLQGAAVYHRTVVPKYSEVSIDLSTATVGQEINLPVNGVMTPHIVVHIGNPDPELYDASCDGVWLLRQDIAENRVWDSGNSNVLESSDIQSYLNNTWINRYNTDIRNAIKQVKIPYRQNGGSGTDRNGANGLSCKIFLLSGREVGFTNNESSNFPNDGAKLDYFISGSTSSAQQKRIAKLNGSATNWWLRSPYPLNGAYVWRCDSGGNHTSWNANASYGVRPAFLLPTTFTATYYVDSNGGIHPSQEYTTAGDFSDLWGNDIPTVKIETGSYTGTGTYGSSNPNTLTFSFEPKIVMIQADTMVGYFSNTNMGFVYFGQDGNPSASGARVFTREGNTFSWYGGTAMEQCNDDGKTFVYVALG